ncbi:hypothetical protein MBLNU230_g2968t1 [Neophaeotheca triangularis]
MADDGMLLNFELPSDAFAPKIKYKGGSWKDRLTARKSAEYNRNKKAGTGANNTRLPDFRGANEGDEELIVPGAQHAAKRARTDNASRGKLTGNSSGPRHGGAVPKSSNGEVISSLWTYNPEGKAAEVEAEPEPEEEETPIQPSNAPLNDELASFTNMGLSSQLAAHLLKKMEIKAPTAIQRKAVEQLCGADTDAFIQAETGSGKTLAYLLPIVQRISTLSKQMKEAGEGFHRESGLFAIILAPTRELSKQISTVLETLLSCCHWIVGGTVIGGEKKQSEKARLRKGINILVATPGRLVDHLNNTEVLDVSKVRWLVLDEGDRLMELGFEQDIQKIVSVMNLRSRKVQEKAIPGLPGKRTTVLCSATIKADVEQLRSIALKDPVSIAVDPADKTGDESKDGQQTAFSAPSQLKQSYAIVPPKQRLVTLVAVLKQAFKRKGSVNKCIVFMSCADSVDFHFELLTSDTSKKATTATTKDEAEKEQSDLRIPKQARTNHIHQGNTISETRTSGPAVPISTKETPVHLYRLHGSLQQSTRTSTLKSFSTSADPSILICTDVASRGLDLPNVDLVLEYDPPFSSDDHVHRIGRTARAGNEGRAMIFLQPGSEEGYIQILKDNTNTLARLTKHTSDELLRKAFAPTSGVVAGGKDWETLATDFQLDVERWVLAHPKHLEQARRAFQSHIRAYATHVAAERKFFDLRSLHLGHLAKAFALRDKPGEVRVPGARPEVGGGGGKGAKKGAGKMRKDGVTTASGSAAGAKRSKAQDFEVEDAVDEREARNRMMQKMKAMGGAAEFNLG